MEWKIPHRLPCELGACVISLCAVEAETLGDVTTQSFLRQGLHDLKQYKRNQPLIDSTMGAIRDTDYFWLSAP